MSPILNKIESAMDTYSRSTRAVAAVVLEQPTRVISMSIVELAELAGVSDPTVLRFTRKLGFDGYKDFKRMLATELSGPTPSLVTPATIGEEGFLPKIVDNYTLSLTDMMSSVDEQAFTAAVDVLRDATKVEFWGQCTSSTLAQDAYDKFFRAGVACFASAGPDQQRLYSRAFGPDDVIIAISHLGHNEEIARSLMQASALGAKTISIATEGSIVAQASTISITTKAVEQTPFNEMIMKAAHVFIVDALALITSEIKSGTDPFSATQL